MAIYHLSAQIIGRSAGRSAVAAAAYRAHERIEDERTGLLHDYSRRRGEIETFILAPKSAPDWVQDRARLWNAAEATEKRSNSQVAREINVALPVELSRQEQRALLQEYVQKLFVNDGMVADVAIHLGDPGNPHAHIMLTTRMMGPDGFTFKNREWNDRDRLQEWRENWANFVNYELRKKGFSDQQIDHRTLEAQGIDRMPQIHEGPNVREMEKKGKGTERGDWNRAAKEHAQLQKQEHALIIELEAYKREREALQKDLDAVRQTEPEKAGAIVIDRHDQLLRERTRIRRYAAIGRELYKLRGSVTNPGLQHALKQMQKEYPRPTREERANVSGPLRAVREKTKDLNRDQLMEIKTRAIHRREEMAVELQEVNQTLAQLRAYRLLLEQRATIQGKIHAFEGRGWVDRLRNKSELQGLQRQLHEVISNIEDHQEKIGHLSISDQEMKQRDLSSRLEGASDALRLLDQVIRERDQVGIQDQHRLNKKQNQKKQKGMRC